MRSSRLIDAETGIFHIDVNSAFVSWSAVKILSEGGRDIRLGSTVNVGVGSNKLLAKMASDFEKPDKVHTLWSEEALAAVKKTVRVGRNLFFARTTLDDGRTPTSGR